ncbi:hypothetical protein BJF79_41520 [Actinomadura sp. CNU-125]|nr:hypothetical protein BJF79_41520 [Actinomadura sp. CNU-125]
MTPGRERGLTALLCAAGAGLVLLAAGRTWATVTANESITPFTRELTGGDLGGAPGALGWAGLAGLAALFATRGRVRAAVGALIALFGVGIGYAAATAARASHAAAEAGDKSALLKLGADPSVHVNAWWTVSVAGGVPARRRRPGHAPARLPLARPVRPLRAHRPRLGEAPPRPDERRPVRDVEVPRPRRRPDGPRRPPDRKHP